MSSSKFFYAFKVILQYLFNIFMLLNTVSYNNLNLKLKIDPKMCTSQNLKEIWKPGKKIEITSGNPDLRKIACKQQEKIDNK